MPRKLQVPGPGAYDVSNPWPSKSISIKGSSRASMQGSEFAPGPGEYAPQGATDKARPRCLFTKSNRFSDMPDDAPGPCEYSPRNPSHVAPSIHTWPGEDGRRYKLCAWSEQMDAYNIDGCGVVRQSRACSIRARSEAVRKAGASGWLRNHPEIRQQLRGLDLAYARPWSVHVRYQVEGAQDKYDTSP
eukprot:TRINITY_DN39759_c0_g1_i2.p1 TRINITY_DN39759_c0_g1~~TRINITY_DN39759_c0_g1_i2.p1  ORF type:complete len:188 (+),score=3.09 TRINITY_DN39759_c0_g1_i2:125-688(+)